MSATAVGLRTGFYATPVGKKAVMAVTGFVLFGYLIAHLLGNLQVFGGAARINAYAHFLHSQPLLLWSARIALGACVILHVLASVQLWLEKRRARPIGYVKKDDLPASYAARTMIWSGPIIAAFVTFHVMHLTTGSVVPLLETPEGGLDVYANIIAGFLQWEISAPYIVAMLLLWPHLFHGLWSMFQSVGVSHPRYTPLLKRLAGVVSSVIALGNISIPVAVLTGVIK